MAGLFGAGPRRFWWTETSGDRCREVGVLVSRRIGLTNPEGSRQPFGGTDAAAWDGDTVAAGPGNGDERGADGLAGRTCFAFTEGAEPGAAAAAAPGRKRPSDESAPKGTHHSAEQLRVRVDVVDLDRYVGLHWRGRVVLDPADLGGRLVRRGERYGLSEVLRDVGRSQ